LGSLLNVVVVKLRYDDETEWDADEDEPEEEALFFEMRKVRIIDYYKDTVLLIKHDRIYASLQSILLPSMKSYMLVIFTLLSWTL
jgi:exportin-T